MTYSSKECLNGLSVPTHLLNQSSVLQEVLSAGGNPLCMVLTRSMSNCKQDGTSQYRPLRFEGDLNVLILLLPRQVKKYPSRECLYECKPVFHRPIATLPVKLSSNEHACPGLLVFTPARMSFCSSGWHLAMQVRGNSVFLCESFRW